VAGDEIVNPIVKWLFPAPKLKPKDAVIGSLGALIAIGVTYWVSDQLIDIEKAPILALAMGASAIIIFMTPRGPMAQPGPVLLAHTIGATVGVTAYKLGDNVILASGIAVAVTALIITTLGCTHPPSGGTAISAVIGSSTITDLGYEYVWRPVLLNAVLLVVLAIVLNAPFADRRYPLPFVKSV
jgi:CBS-domain-containing membrane protein